MGDATASGAASQYLTFTLEDEVFAMEITRVREVLEWPTITKLPQMQRFIRGVINLRGAAVPVVDLKRKLGIGETGRTVDTRIVITEVAVDGVPIVLGVLADSVQEVIELDDQHIEPPPQIGSRLRTEFIQGMAKRAAAFLILVDIERIFSAAPGTECLSGSWGCR